MSIYEGDQQQSAVSVVNGVHSVTTPAQVKAAQTTGFTTYQFTTSFVYSYPAINGVSVSYRKGVAYSLDALLKAALLAAGAPMVAV